MLSSSCLACPVIWGRRYSCLPSSSTLPCLLGCLLHAWPSPVIWGRRYSCLPSSDILLCLLGCLLHAWPSPVIWGRRYSCLPSSDILLCLLGCLLHAWLVPSSGVAGIAVYAAMLIVLSSFSPVFVIYLLHASFHLRFGLPLLICHGMSISSILLTMCSFFILLTWPNHFSRFSVIFLATLAPLLFSLLPLICALLNVTFSLEDLYPMAFGP